MNERAKGYTTFMAKFQDGKTYLIWVAGGRGKESSSSEDDIGLLVLDLEAWVSFCLTGREVGRGHSGINRRMKSRRRPKRKKNVGWSCQGRSVRRICMSHRSCMSQCLKDTDRIPYVILQTRVKSKPGNVKEAQQERQQGDQSPPSSIAPLPNPQGTQSSQWALGWYAGHALGSDYHTHPACCCGQRVWAWRISCLPVLVFHKPSLSDAMTQASWFTFSPRKLPDVQVKRNPWAWLRGCLLWPAQPHHTSPPITNPPGQHLPSSPLIKPVHQSTWKIPPEKYTLPPQSLSCHCCRNGTPSPSHHRHKNHKSTSRHNWITQSSTLPPTPALTQPAMYPYMWVPLQTSP